MATKRDYYDVLGVDKKANTTDIKSAYRKLALKWHPDKNKETNAEEKFKEINEAYEILSSKEKKQKYDQFGHAAFGQAGGPSPFSQAGGQAGRPFRYTYQTSGNFQDFMGNIDPFEIFENFFGGRGFRTQPPKLHYSLKVDFMDAIEGIERKIIHQGKQFTIKVPPGSDTGTRIRYNEFDISLNVKPHKVFKRDGYDVYLEYEIPFTTAILGGNITVPTLDKDLKLKVRPGTQPNTLTRLSNKGIKHLRSSQKGDFYILLKVTIPKRLNRKQKDLLKQFTNQ